MQEATVAAAGVAPSQSPFLAWEDQVGVGWAEEGRWGQVFGAGEPHVQILEEKNRDCEELPAARDG